MLSLQNLTRVAPVSGAPLLVPETIGTIDTPEFLERAPAVPGSSTAPNQACAHGIAPG
jgi:hypothetical protein